MKFKEYKYKYIFGRTWFTSLSVCVWYRPFRFAGRTAAAAVLSGRFWAALVDDVGQAASDIDAQVVVVYVRLIVDDEQFRLVWAQFDSLDDLKGRYFILLLFLIYYARAKNQLLQKDGHGTDFFFIFKTQPLKNPVGGNALPVVAQHVEPVLELPTG